MSNHPSIPTIHFPALPLVRSWWDMTQIPRGTPERKLYKQVGGYIITSYAHEISHWRWISRQSKLFNNDGWHQIPFRRRTNPSTPGDSLKFWAKCATLRGLIPAGIFRSIPVHNLIYYGATLRLWYEYMRMAFQISLLFNMGSHQGPWWLLMSHILP